MKDCKQEEGANKTRNYKKLNYLKKKSADSDEVKYMMKLRGHSNNLWHMFKHSVGSEAAVVTSRESL